MFLLGLLQHVSLLTNGSKSLSGEVSQVVIGRTGATGTFDAGVVAVGYSK
jgi:hypothetical protein